MDKIWHKLNNQLTQAEREEFNQWRIELYFMADRQRDILRRCSMRYSVVNAKEADKLCDFVCKIPVFER